MTPLRRSRLALCVLPWLAALLPACDDEIGLGGIANYTKKPDAADQPSIGTDPVGGGSGSVVLTALYTGMQLIPGIPDVGLLSPTDNSQGVFVTTPIVAVFSESMNPATITASTFTLTSEGGGSVFGGGGGIFGGGGGGGGIGGDSGGPVTATVVPDPDSNGRVFLLLPLAPLSPATRYTIRLASTISDVQGDLLKVTASAGGDGSGGTGGTGGTGGVGGIFGGGGDTGGDTGAPGFTEAVRSSFTTLSSVSDASLHVTSIFPASGDKNVPVDSMIKVFFNMPVTASIQNPGLFTVTANGLAVDGTVKVQTDPRVVAFTPAQPLPQGKSVKIVLSGSIQSANVALPDLMIGQGGQGGIPQTMASFFLNGTETMAGEAFTSAFTTSSVPVPTIVKFPGNAPVTVLGQEFAASINTVNQSKFAVQVKVPTATVVDSVTLLLFQAQGVGATAPQPIARAFTLKGAGPVFDFTLDLGAGGGFAQSQGVPPLPVLAGAFATLGGDNSPVGPPVLPEIFVETSKPDVAFGPPTRGSNPLDLVTTLRRPALYGRATEPLSRLRAIVDSDGVPTTFDAIALQGKTAITDADLGFITEAGTPALPGFDPFAKPLFRPLSIDDLVFEDLFGNEVEKKQKAAGRLRQEGSLGGSLEPGAAPQLRVRVVAENGLDPIAGADVQVNAFPFDPLDNLALPIRKKSGPNGEVSFAADELSVFGDRLTVTAASKGFDLLSIADFGSPGRDAAFGVSLPLHATGDEGVLLQVDTSANIPAQDDDMAFVAAATGTARPKDGASSLSDSSFATAALAPTKSLKLKTPPNRPQIVSVLEHDGNGTFVFQSGRIATPAEKSTQTFSFLGTGIVLPILGTVASTVVEKADVTDAGIVGDPMERTRGRLVARLPGLPGVQPLTFTPMAIDTMPAPDPLLRVLFAPIPSTLWVNESVGDPTYELLLQPGAALGTMGVDAALLDGALSLEVEAAEEATTRLIRQRAHLHFDVPIGAQTDEAIELPKVPAVGIGMAVHPPILGLTDADVEPSISVFRLELAPQGSDRRWVVLLRGQGLADSGFSFQYPTTKAQPFEMPGAYTATVEEFEMPVTGFDFESFVFSDLEREQHKYARSAKSPVIDTTPQ